MHPPEFPHSYSIYKQTNTYIIYHAILFHSNASRDFQRSIITILAHVQFRAFFRASSRYPEGQVSVLGRRPLTDRQLYVLVD
jgi:hypothetical protein